MNQSHRSNSHSQGTNTDKVLEKISEILNIVGSHAYVFRGEPERFEKVSSGLYRFCAEIGMWDPADLCLRMQSMILEKAKEYLHETDNFEILAQIQHYGGRTNLIDFTAKYPIALFFACEKSHDQDGRVIILKDGSSKNYSIRDMREPIDRAAAQKSLFVETPKGFIDDKAYTEIQIPKDLKRDMLIYLQNRHGISTKTIYNDIHGFIHSLRRDELPYRNWLMGTEYEQEGEYEKSLQRYTEAIELKLDFFEGYSGRGLVYSMKGEFADALADYTTAIELDPNNADYYYMRGQFYFEMGEFVDALADYTTAMELDPNNADYYHAKGRLYFEMGEFVDALANYTTARQLKPDNDVLRGDYHHTRGRSYFKSGEFHLALAEYNEAINLKPDTAILYRDRGTLYLKEGDDNQAIKDYSEWIKLEDEENIDVLLARLEKYTQECDVKLPEEARGRIKQLVEV